MLELRSLRPADVDDAMALSTQAGWNQVPADWERLLSLASEGCFAGTVEGELVATATVVTYGDVAWIGMVLVDEDHRSRGYGSRIFERGLEYAREAGDRIVGLDATHLGEPIYGKYGFETVATVFRWQGELASGGTGVDPDRVRQLSSTDADDLATFDRHRVGVDRSGLLRELLGEEGVRGYGLDGPDGALAGYAVVRPGRTSRQIGPLVADREGIAPLLSAVGVDVGSQQVIVDAPADDPVAGHLAATGLERDRELVRMTHPEAEPALLGGSVRAFTCFAFG
ncbi:GNAT family N-acetyltransferase [Saliphagus sp. LR7]|uniref:GNAT family N-acetyltransferase n=1 Tax=Saliphagus sp. LR7 TaxID=2282654 RepID=UPI000DF73C9F|nr:GNAT family N-acetyltransferase [Saliphagus sp. LR7]